MSRALLNGIHRVTAQSFCQIAKDHRRPEVEFSPDEHVPPKNGIGLHPLSPGKRSGGGFIKGGSAARPVASSQ
jgi:hypothetical protein